MAEPEQQSFRLAIGQAKVLDITMDDPPAGGVSAWTMRFRLRKPGGTVLIEKETGSGITCTDTVNGEWEVAIDEEDTFPPSPATALKTGLYDWAFWRTDDGSETPLAFGTCTLYRTAETG